MRISRFCFGILMAFSCSCASSWAEKAPTWTPAKPVPALLASYRLHTPHAKGMSVVGMITTAVTGDPLGSVPADTVDLFQAALLRWNMAVSLDATRAHKLQGVNLPTEGAAGTAATALTNVSDVARGIRTHPDTSVLSFDNQHWVFGDYYKNIAQKLAGQQPDEVFLSAEVYARSERNWLIMSRCVTGISMRAIDKDGNPVFQAVTGGVSSSTFGSALDPDHIKEAMGAAFQALSTAKTGSSPH